MQVLCVWRSSEQLSFGKSWFAVFSNYHLIQLPGRLRGRCLCVGWVGRCRSAAGSLQHAWAPLRSGPVPRSRAEEELLPAAFVSQPAGAGLEHQWHLESALCRCGVGFQKRPRAVSVFSNAWLSCVPFGKIKMKCCKRKESEKTRVIFA